MGASSAGLLFFGLIQRRSPFSAPRFAPRAPNGVLILFAVQLWYRRHGTFDACDGMVVRWCI